MNIKLITKDEYSALSSYSQLSYAFYKTLYGLCLIAIDSDNISYMAFTSNQEESLQDLKRTWLKNSLREDKEYINGKIGDFIACILDESKPLNKLSLLLHNNGINILLKGTSFQMKIWQELLKVKSGYTLTYNEIAAAIGRPRAVRAVASAIAANNIAYIVPCHRIVRKSGEIYNYKWGRELKKKFLIGENN